MNALIYVIETLLSLVFFLFLLRLLMQLVRADFRNPIAQAVVRLTNPLVLPLRRVLPPAGKVDTASVVAVLDARQVASTPELLARLHACSLAQLRRAIVLALEVGSAEQLERALGSL